MALNPRLHVKKLYTSSWKLGLSWQGRILHVNILQSTSRRSIEALIIPRELRWIGHVIKMPEDCPPKRILYWEISEGQRYVREQKKNRFKDPRRVMLKQCGTGSQYIQSQLEDAVRPLKDLKITKIKTGNFAGKKTSWSLVTWTTDTRCRNSVSKQ